MELYKLRDWINKVDFLKSLPMFSKLSRDGLTSMSYSFKESTFKRNSIVFKEGEVADNWYIVIEGEFEATKNVTISNK